VRDQREKVNERPKTFGPVESREEEEQEGGWGWVGCVCVGGERKDKYSKKKEGSRAAGRADCARVLFTVVVVNVWNGDSTDKPKEKRIKFTRREIIPKILPLNFISRIIVSVRINYIRK
jgi:hypothetical protein